MLPGSTCMGICIGVTMGAAGLPNWVGTWGCGGGLSPFGPCKTGAPGTWWFPLVMFCNHAYTAMVSPCGSWALVMHLAIILGTSMLGWGGVGAEEAC